VLCYIDNILRTIAATAGQVGLFRLPTCQGWNMQKERFWRKKLPSSGMTALSHQSQHICVQWKYSCSSPPRAGASSHVATPHPMYNVYTATPCPMQHEREIEDEDAPFQFQGGEEAHNGVRNVLLLSSSQSQWRWRMQHTTPPLLLMMEEASYSLPSIRLPSWARCHGTWCILNPE